MFNWTTIKDCFELHFEIHQLVIIADGLLNYLGTSDVLLVLDLLKEDLIKLPYILCLIQSVVFSKVYKCFYLEWAPLKLTVLLILQVVKIELVTQLVVLQVIKGIDQLLKIKQSLVLTIVLWIDKALVLTYKIIEAQVILILFI